MIVTIDGPAGAGKSTVARKLAKKLGFIHLNSGALFRAVAFKAQQQELALDDDEGLSAVARETDFVFDLVDDQGANGEQVTRLLVDGQDISSKLSVDSIGGMASKIAVLPNLREVLLEVQRRVAQGQSVVLEGRDSGTVVFPWAEVKFYLDADPDVRAHRRYQELESAGKLGGLTLEEVKRDMLARDHREMSREHAPLRRAEDAMLVDSSELSADGVVELMCQVARNRTPA